VCGSTSARPCGNREEAGQPRPRPGMISLRTRGCRWPQLAGVACSNNDRPLAGACHAGPAAFCSIGADHGVVECRRSTTRSAGIQTDERRKWPVPDRAARRVAVHAGCACRPDRGLPDGAASPDVQVARGGSAARKTRGKADGAAVALVDTVEVLRPRPLTALGTAEFRTRDGAISARAGTSPGCPRFSVSAILRFTRRWPAAWTRGVVGARQRDRDSQPIVSSCPGG